MESCDDTTFRNPTLSELLESGRVEEYVERVYGAEYVEQCCLDMQPENPCDDDLMEGISS